MKPDPQTTEIKVGDRVKVPQFPNDIYTVCDIDMSGDEPIAFFQEQGFWRCSQLEKLL